MRTAILCCLTLLLVGAGPLLADDDLVLADFEGESYAPWTVTGEAFGSGPARGTLPNQMLVEGFRGRGLVNTFHRGDDTVGTLTSPEFRIERKYIAFLIGGGKHEEQLALQLLVDGKIVRKATGPNDRAGGSEALAPDAWDVAEFLGRTAVLKIVDNARGGWGHINVDHITQTNQRPKGFVTNAERTFPVAARYLHLPIKNGAPKRQVTLLVAGQAVVKNEIELADAEPDWWAPLDVSAWSSQIVTLRVDKLREDSQALTAITASDSLRDAERLYDEPLRGQFHFSPRRGWNNDPNGMVYFQGEYHLFFQHNPYGWGWGNMHWGHAVSRDLVYWEELGDKLLPDDLGPMFSGGAVVDWNNTSGLGVDNRPPLVLIYTAAGNPTVQCLAYSTDGRRFTKYSGNPVVPQITGGNRDPKVIWHEPTKKWVMALYVEQPAGRHTVQLLISPNLREWRAASVVEGDRVGQPYLFECPDFFPLPIDGNPQLQKWVLLGANSQYAIGDFDGERFRADAERLPGHRGRGFYAPQTFSDLPAQDGRRIQIGWFQTETRGMPFNQSMTIPLELRLTDTADGPRLTFQPVRELATLRAKSRSLPAFQLAPDAENPLAAIQAELVELRLECAPQAATELSLTLRGVPVIWEAKEQVLVVNGHRTSAPLRDGKLRLTLYVDRTGLEVFASDGLTYVPMPVNVAAEQRSISIATRGGTAQISKLEVHELRSAWKRP